MSCCDPIWAPASHGPLGEATSNGSLAIPHLTDEEPIRQMWNAFANLGGYEGHVLDASNGNESETVGAIVDLLGPGGEHFLLD